MHLSGIFLDLTKGMPLEKFTCAESSSKVCVGQQYRIEDSHRVSSISLTQKPASHTSNQAKEGERDRKTQESISLRVEESPKENIQ